MIHHITTGQLKGLAGGDGLILQGCGGDPADWQKGINEMLTTAGILKNSGEFKDIYVFKHEDSTNILYPFDNMDSDTLDMGKLAAWRLQTHGNFGGTWHSDYLENKFGIKDYYVGCGPYKDGVAVWNWNDTEHADGSEKHIAFISDSREITYLEDNLPTDVVDEIKSIAGLDWKEFFAIEMAEFDYNPSPPPNRDDNAEGPHPSDMENDSQPTHPITINIENALDANLYSFSVSLPITQEELQPFIDGAEITDWRDVKIWEVSSDIIGLGDRLYAIISDNGMTPATLDELNYLATRIDGLQPNGYEIFCANIEAGRNCTSIAEMINLTFNENLNQFDVFPTFNAGDYGDTLVNQFMMDEHAIVFNRLKDSEDPADRAFATHVEKLEKHVDLTAFGRTTMQEEGGVFTEQGYLVGGSDGLQLLYTGSQDIPTENLLLSQSARDVPYVMKIDDANVAETIVKLHAVGCRSMEYAAANVKVFFDQHKSYAENNDFNYLPNHYVLFLNRSDICIAPAMEVYKRGSEMCKFALSMSELAAKGNRADISIFAVRINNVHEIGEDKTERDLRGDLIELSPKAFNSHITRYSATPDSVDALHDDGTKKSYDLFSWSQMLQTQNGESAGLYALHYSDISLKEAGAKFGMFMGNHELMSHAESFEAHLPRINAPYANAPMGTDIHQPGMISVANEVAKEILARGDADVFRIVAGDYVKLNTFEALRPMCFSEYHDLAVKKEDALGLDTWAKHKVSGIVRKLEKEAAKETRKKSHGEDEL